MLSSIYYGEIQSDKLVSWNKNKDPYDILVENNRVEVRATATLLHRMELCLQWLRKYPGKGAIYYDMLYPFYFSGFNNGHKVVAEMFDMSRTTYYRYFKEAEITYSKLLWTNNLTEGSET